MRRRDREITDRAAIDAIIHGAEICHLGLVSGGEPYVLPISFGYDGEAVYFHTAHEGRKIESLAAGERVCCQFDRGVGLVRHDDEACEWTFDFESAIGWGDADELVGAAAKLEGLNHIMRHYSGRDWEMPERAVAGTRVWRIALATVTGKRSRTSANAST
jgi:nitroimidazol reductase NimA-like FMN-containing flavoprotein (pyridoxamine 5'-phosphate oxidase superfamily)